MSYYDRQSALSMDYRIYIVASNGALVQTYQHGFDRVNNTIDEEQGLCRYCGGQMGAIFTKKCKACGRSTQ
jgi:tRNA(Ile2) C34 agmatinyltransferase TiaS